MNICEKASINSGAFLADILHVQEFIDSLALQRSSFAHGESPAIKKLLTANLSSTGWVVDARVTPRSKISVNALREKIIVQIQLGNIARAFYDLLKLETMFRNKRAIGAILVVPMRQAGARLGQNVASYERVFTELEDYKSVVTIPLLLIGVGN